MSSAGGSLVNIARGSLALGDTFASPIATPDFKRFRLTTMGLRANYRTVESQELVSTFRVKQLRRVGQDCGGQLGCEFVYGNLDDQLEVLVFSRWIKTPQRFNSAADTEIAGIVASTGVITIIAADATNDNRIGTFAVGHLVRSTGQTAAGNNFLKRVTAASGTTLTVSTSGLVDDTAPAASARLKAVGLEAPANGDIQITTSGITGTEVCIINGPVALNFTSLGLAAGYRFKLSGSANAANNGWYRAKTVTAQQIRCDRAPTGVTTNTEASTQVRIWLADVLRDGTDALNWFDIEVQFPQLTVPEYHYYLSMVPSAWGIRLGPQGIIGCSMDYVGSHRTTGTSRVAGPSDLTIDAVGAIPRVGDMFDTTSNVAQISVGGSPLVDVVTAIDYSIANGAQGLPVIANIGAGRIVRPRFRPTATLRSYYDSRALLANLENDTEISINTILTDPLGTRAFSIDMPSAKISSSELENVQVDAELEQPIAFTGIENTGYSCAIQLFRWEEYA